MKKFLFNLKLCVIALGLCLFGITDAYAVEKTGTIKFGTKGAKIDGKSVTVQDKIDGKEANEWSISTVGTTSFTQNQEYSQVGSSNKPATSITFTTTLPSNSNIKAFSAKFGGFSGTAGNISLKVGSTEVKTGKLSGTSNVEVESNQSVIGQTLTITIDKISKGVKVYYITYTYEEAGSGQPVKELSSISVSGTPEEFKVGDTFNHNGMTVSANYSDNSSEDVTSAATFKAPEDMTTAGKKTVTVTYEGKSATYEINVAENSTSSISNTKETAYTTAQAIALIDAGNDLDTKVYVKGTVSKVDSYSSKYKSITYWLDNNTFEVYGGISKLGKDFGSKNDIKVGATVVVFGNLAKHNTTYEFATNSELVEYVAPAVVNVAPSFTKHPENNSYTKGAKASLTVAVAGTPTPTLQWYVNTVNTTEGGDAIDGATSTTYKPSTTELGTKYYYCVATNSVGSVASKISAVHAVQLSAQQNAYEQFIEAHTNDEGVYVAPDESSTETTEEGDDIVTSEDMIEDGVDSLETSMDELGGIE